MLLFTIKLPVSESFVHPYCGPVYEPSPPKGEVTPMTKIFLRQFKGIGLLPGEYKIDLDPEATPVQL